MIISSAYRGCDIDYVSCTSKIPHTRDEIYKLIHGTHGYSLGPPWVRQGARGSYGCLACMTGAGTPGGSESSLRCSQGVTRYALKLLWASWRQKLEGRVHWDQARTSEQSDPLETGNCLSYAICFKLSISFGYCHQVLHNDEFCYIIIMLNLMLIHCWREFEAVQWVASPMLSAGEIQRWHMGDSSVPARRIKVRPHHDMVSYEVFPSRRARKGFYNAKALCRL